MFKVSPLFGDHAILPLGKELRIFGTADEGETIRATLTAADGAATGEGVSIAREGRFLIHLPPQKVSAGPLTLSLTSRGWHACSGQGPPPWLTTTAWTRLFGNSQRRWWGVHSPP